MIVGKSEMTLPSVPKTDDDVREPMPAHAPIPLGAFDIGDTSLGG